MSNEKVRKVFLENLPRKEGIGNNKNKLIIDWIKCKGHKVNGIYDNINFEVEIIDYKDSYLYLKYLDKPTFKMWTSTFTKCGVGGLIGTKTKEFKVKIGQAFKDENRNIVITDREIRFRNKKDGSKFNEKWYKYTCNKCGWTEGWIVESHLLQATGCACCCASPQIVVENINSIVATTIWMIPYFQGGYDEARLYTKTSNKKIYPICPDCGRVKDKKIPINSIYYNHSIGCTCSDKISYPNKLAYSLLNQLNEIYGFYYLKHEYSPEWIGKCLMIITLYIKVKNTY